MPVFYRPLSASAVASFRWPSDLEVKNGVASLVPRNAASSRDSFGAPPEVLWAPRSPGSRATHAISYPELPSKLYSSWKWQGEREKLELPCRSPLGSDDRSCCYCNLSLKLLLPFSETTAFFSDLIGPLRKFRSVRLISTRRWMKGGLGVKHLRDLWWC